METYIALLRGINVSGQKKILMEDLRQLLAALGFKDIRTYIQSGNVVFGYKKTPYTKLAAIIEKAIKDHYQFDVPTIIRTPAELTDALENNPHIRDADLNPKGIYVAFLDSTPDKADVDKTVTIQYPPDQYLIDGDRVHIHYNLGAGTTKLTNMFFEKKLKRSATSRNLNTIRELIRMGAAE